MASIVTNLTCELTAPVSVVFLPGNMFSMDNGGNIINVFVVQNGEPVALGGSVSANVIRSDGTTVAITGALEGNKAYIILPQACYAVPGIIHIVMKITEGTTITTIAAVTANVYQSSTDAVVDPGQLVPSIAALIEAIEDAVDSIPVDYSGLLATLAADYSTSKTYKVGDYAWYGGVLKRCIVAITTAESYTAAHWTNAVIGDDLSQLKNALNSIGVEDDVTENWVQGYIRNDTGAIGQDYSACTTSFLLSSGSFIKIVLAAGYRVKVAQYQQNQSFDKILMTVTDEPYEFFVPKGWYYRVQVAVTSGTLAPSAVTDSICAIKQIIYTDKSLSVSGIPADAKATGDRFITVEEIEYLRTSQIVPIWTNGYIKNDGTKGDDSQRCVTSYLRISGIVKLTIASGHIAKLVVMNSSKSPIESKSQLTGTCIINCDGDYIRIQIQKDPISSISPSYVTRSVIAIDVFHGDCETINAMVERGSLASGNKRSNTINSYNTFFRNAYDIDVSGSSSFDYDFIDENASNIVVVFKDAQHSIISSESFSSYRGYTSFPQGTKYIAFEFRSNANIENIHMSFYGQNMNIKQTKRYPVGVDDDGCESITIKVNDDICTTIRIMLPPNYEYEGKKVPLILYLDGSMNFNTWGTYITSNATKLRDIQYARDEGFAILSVYGWGSYFYEKYEHCANNQHYVTPTNIACVKAGLNYACDRYNIDPDNVHIMCKSQGGQFATYCVTNPIWDFRSIGMFSPVNDFLSMPASNSTTWLDTKKALIEEFDLQNGSVYLEEITNYTPERIAFWTENISSLTFLNEAWTGLIGGTLLENFSDSIESGRTYWEEERWHNPNLHDIYNKTNYKKIGKVPVRIWAAKNDADTPYLKSVELIAQLQNGGTDASIKVAEVGSHSYWDVDTQVASVTTELGITCTNIGVGWVENIAWLRTKMPK